TDGSREAAARRGARVVVQTERGYGGALLAGFAATTAPWILTMDADLSHRPVFAQELWKRRHEAEVLIASRYVPGGRADMEGLRVVEVPFHYMARGSGRSHARLVKFGWALTRTLARMWRLRNSVDAADYDYRAYDGAIWLQRYWQRTRHRIVTGWVGEGPVVDVGCGSSRIIVDLAAAVGIDIRHSKLRWLRPRHARLTRASGDGLPLRDASVGTLIT